MVRMVTAWYDVEDQYQRHESDNYREWGRLENDLYTAEASLRSGASSIPTGQEQMTLVDLEQRGGSSQVVATFDWAHVFDLDASEWSTLEEADAALSARGGQVKVDWETARGDLTGGGPAKATYLRVEDTPAEPAR